MTGVMRVTARGTAALCATAAAATYFLAPVPGHAHDATRDVVGNWYTAKPYDHPHCSINGSDTVVVCDDGRVILSPRAVHRIRNGHHQIGHRKHHTL